MQELRGDIWNYHEDGQWIVITTNGAVRHDGACVMGRGVALQAAQKFPDLPYRIGDRIRQSGNHVYAFTTLRIFSFPVKRIWSETASLSLIVESAEQLVKFLGVMKIDRVYCVRPGCGNGGLTWSTVKPSIETIFDDRVCIVEKS